MYKKPDINQKYLAEELIKANGFCLYDKEPFRTVSGLQEPFFMDHRTLYYSTEVRNFLANSLVRLLLENYGLPDVIVGVAIGALPLATMVADKLGLPLAYVRPKAKEYARKRLIEGVLPEGAKAVIVEDAVIKATSSINAYNAIISQKASVLGIVSIYNQKLDAMYINLNKLNLKNVSIYDVDDLLTVAKQIGYLTQERFDEIQAWRKDPENYFNNKFGIKA